MLEHLWAGWRSAYVRGITDPATPERPPAGEGSVFTRILRSGLPDTETHVVHRGPSCFAILNAYPYASGHLLVLPYREVGELELLTPDETAELWATVTDGVSAVRAASSPEGINVGLNLGRPAGGSVSDHLHVHVVPRWTGDSNFMTAIANTRTLPEPLADSAQRIRAAWPVPPGGRKLSGA
ncbi:MAG: HIT domain-containing protein [Ilumatobacteraceae bacterium]